MKRMKLGEAAPTTTSTASLFVLPREVLLHVLLWLSADEVARFGQVSRRAFSVSRAPSLWTRLCLNSGIPKGDCSWMESFILAKRPAFVFTKMQRTMHDMMACSPLSLPTDNANANANACSLLQEELLKLKHYLKIGQRIQGYVKYLPFFQAEYVQPFLACIVRVTQSTGSTPDRFGASARSSLDLRGVNDTQGAELITLRSHTYQGEQCTAANVFTIRGIPAARDKTTREEDERQKDHRGGGGAAWLGMRLQPDEVVFACNDYEEPVRANVGAVRRIRDTLSLEQIPLCPLWCMLVLAAANDCIPEFYFDNFMNAPNMAVWDDLDVAGIVL